jgi:hypothetical protein
MAMRSTINSTANNPIRDRQDRTNQAGVGVHVMHLALADLRLVARQASESPCALASGKRALKQAFAGAIAAAEFGLTAEPRGSARQSYRPWRLPRAASSPACPAIALS